MLRRLGGWWPRGGVVAARGVALATRPLGRGIPDDWLAAVYPDLPAAARRRVQQEAREGFLKSSAAAPAVRRRGTWPVLPNPRLARLRPPLVLASFHAGPLAVLDPLLASLPAEVVALHRHWGEDRAGYTLLRGGGDASQRALAFARALAALRAGGIAFLNVDGHEPGDYAVATIEVPMLGRTLPLARGAFALARLAEAPIVPIVPRWRGTAVEVELGDPIGPSRDERELAEATGAWLERYLRERPGEVSAFMLERLRPPLPGR